MSSKSLKSKALLKQNTRPIWVASNSGKVAQDVELKTSFVSSSESCFILQRGFSSWPRFCKLDNNICIVTNM